MVGDLLDYSRLDAGRLTLIREQADLPSLVRGIVERLVPSLGDHPVKVETRGVVPPVRADPGRVEQIMTNLLTNAAKYSRPETEISVGIGPADGGVQVSVADKGPGIPPEEIPHLFHRFYRREEVRRQREGLGLYITKGLVEAHGGRIWVEGEVGVGSTFYFILPVEESSIVS